MPLAITPRPAFTSTLARNGCRALTDAPFDQQVSASGTLPAAGTVGLVSAAYSRTRT